MHRCFHFWRSLTNTKIVLTLALIFCYHKICCLLTNKFVPGTTVLTTPNVCCAVDDNIYQFIELTYTQMQSHTATQTDGRTMRLHADTIFNRHLRFHIRFQQFYDINRYWFPINSKLHKMPCHKTEMSDTIPVLV